MELAFKNEKKAKQKLKEQIKQLTNEVDAMAQSNEVKDNRPKILNKVATAEIKIGKIQQRNIEVRHEISIVEEELGLFEQDPRELNDLVKRLQDEVTYISNERLIIADNLRALQARYDDVHFKNSRDLY